VSELDPRHIQQLSDQFEEMCRARHEMGAKTYGPVKFLEVDSVEMAMEEVADLANYARYTWIKLALILAATTSEPDHPTDVQGPAPTNFVNPYRAQEAR